MSSRHFPLFSTYTVLGRDGHCTHGTPDSGFVSCRFKAGATTTQKCAHKLTTLSRNRRCFGICRSHLSCDLEPNIVIVGWSLFVRALLSSAQFGTPTAEGNTTVFSPLFLFFSPLGLVLLCPRQCGPMHHALDELLVRDLTECTTRIASRMLHRRQVHEYSYSA